MSAQAAVYEANGLAYRNVCTYICVQIFTGHQGMGYFETWVQIAGGDKGSCRCSYKVACGHWLEEKRRSFAWKKQWPTVEVGTKWNFHPKAQPFIMYKIIHYITSSPECQDKC